MGVYKTQSNQARLFETSVESLLEQFDVTPAIVTEWYQSGYLSFDPLAFKELEEDKETEFIFIASLFKSGLSLKSVESLLERLDKPYQYNMQSVYFDFLKNDWEYKTIIPDVEDQIDELIDCEEIEELENLKGKIELFLDEYDKDDE